MDEELIRRADDLAERCCRTASVTASGFLTPAEVFCLRSRRFAGGDCTLLLRGGHADAERCVAFFLPDWMDPDSFDESEYICALRISAPPATATISARRWGSAPAGNGWATSSSTAARHGSFACPPSGSTCC